MSKTGKRSVYVRARRAELLDRAMEFEAEESGEEPSISRTVEAAVRAYVRPRVGQQQWHRDVTEACDWLYEERHRDGDENEDMVVEACYDDAKRSAYVLECRREGQGVSDDEVAAAGWTPVADGYEFTGLKTARAIEAQQRLKAQEAGPFEG